MILLFIAAAFALALGGYTWRRREVPGTGYFVALVLALAEWSLTYLLELGSSDLTTKLFWVRLEYLGIVAVPILWLALVLQYTGHDRWLTRRNLIRLSIVPALTLLFIWTNPNHGLFWKQIRLDTAGGFPNFVATFGPAFWVHTAYSYLLMLASYLLLLWAFLRLPALYRRQIGILLLAGCIPLAGNFLYLTDHNPLPHLDLTPFTFILASLVITWGMHHYRLLDVMPVARDVVMTSIAEGVIVLDTQNRVVDINPAAEKIVCQPATAVVGRPIIEVLPAQRDLVERYLDVSEVHTEIHLQDGRCIYELQISPLHDRWQRFIGRVVLLHKITERWQAQEALRRREAILYAVAFAATRFLETPCWEQHIDAVLARLGQAMDVSRVYIFENHVGPEGELLTSQRYEWVATGIPPQIGNPDLQNVPWVAGGFGRWVDLLGRGEILSGHVRTFPESEQAVLTPQGILSIAVVPIFVGPVWWGFIGFDECRQEKEWSSMELKALHVAAQTLGAAIQRHQIEEENRFRRRFLATLNEITLAAIAASDFQTTLQTLSDRMGELLNADGCYITLWDNERQQVIPTTAYGHLREIYPTVSVKPDEVTLTESVLRAGHPLPVEDTFHTPYLSPRIAALFPTRSLLGLPLIADGRKLGAALIAFHEPHQFTAEEIACGELAARQVALAVAKAQSLERERKQRQLAEALREVGTALTTILNSEAILDCLLDQIARVIPYDTANVMVIQGEHVRVAHVRGYEVLGSEDDLNILDIVVKIAQLPTLQRMIETRQPLVISDTATHPDWVHLESAAHVRSWAGAPIIIQNEVVAFFALDKTEPGFYRQEHAEALAAFAGHAALALQNARLYEAEHRRAVQQETLNAIIAATVSAGQLSDLLETTLDHILQALEAEVGAIWIGAEATTRGMSPEIGPIIRQTTETEAADYRISRPEVVTDWQAIPETDPLAVIAPVMERFNIRASLRVPVVAEGQLIGALVVAAPHPRVWSAEEVALLEAVGYQLGSTAERLRLFEEIQTRATEMVRLTTLSTPLNRSLSLSEVIEVIGQGVLNLSHADRVAVYLRESQERFSCAWSHGLSAEYVNQVTEQVRDLPGWKFVDRTDPVLIQNLQMEARDALLYQLGEREGIQAIALWPLAYEGATVAVVGCYYDAPHIWTQVEQEVMEAFCRQAAMALENARLFEAMQSRAREAETLRQAGTVVTATLDLGEAIERILVELEQVVPYDSASVQLMRDGYLEIVDGRGWADPAAVVGLRFPIPGDNPNTVVVQERRPLILEDALAAYPIFREEPHRYIRSWLGVPLIFHNRVVGMLTMESADPHHFQEEHARVVAAFADQVAIAIENARLYAAEQERASQLEALHQATTALLTTLEQDAVLDRTLQGALQMIQAAEKGVLYLVDPETGRLRVGAVHGYEEVSLPPFYTEVIRKHWPLLIKDQPLGPAPAPNGRPSTENGNQSVLVVPLLLEGRALGILSLEARPQATFTTDDLQLLTTFAATATTAIHNVHLHAKMQKLATLDSLTGIYNRRTFLELGERELARARRHGLPLAMLMIDVDHFKQINDTYGHVIGDQVLVELTRLWKQGLRIQDLVGRYGGEEFVVLLPDTPPDGAMCAAERIRRLTAETEIETPKGPVCITLSLGVAMLDDDAIDLEAILGRADQALYMAKQTGRNRVCMWSAEMQGAKHASQ